MKWNDPLQRLIIFTTRINLVLSPEPNHRHYIMCHNHLCNSQHMYAIINRLYNNDKEEDKNDNDYGNIMSG